MFGFYLGSGFTRGLGLRCHCPLELNRQPHIFSVIRKIRGALKNRIILKSLIAYISTRSTLTPQGSVASSSEDCMTWLIDSLSERISARFFVPRTFRNVVAASKRVEWLERWGERKVVICTWRPFDGWDGMEPDKLYICSRTCRCYCCQCLSRAFGQTFGFSEPV